LIIEAYPRNAVGCDGTFHINHGETAMSQHIVQTGSKVQFDEFIGAVKQQMQPEARAQHLIGILQQLFAFTPEDTTLADLAAGWQVLARPHRENEEAPVTHRREICAKLAAVAAELTSEPGNLAAAVNTWQAWQDGFQRSADPRKAAMAKNLARELRELQTAS
jgi:hypothetical protein